MRKTCFKCELEKPLSEFYKHPAMADGHLGKCKECAKADGIENRSNRRSQYAAYERQRNQSTERKLKAKQYLKTRRARFPIKDKARNAVNNALRDGKLQRQSCEVCGEARSEAHHEDYTKPLEVRWLCFRHHREEHGQVVMEEQAVYSTACTERIL